MHVAREGECNKEGAERNGIERPRGQLESGGKFNGKPIADGLGEETSVVVYACRKRLAEQTEREDAPERGFGKTVENHVLGGLFHAQSSRVDFLHHRQQNARQHIQQQRIHDGGQQHGAFEGAVRMDEEAVEDGQPKRMCPIDGGGDVALHKTNRNQQKPAEGNASVHIA